MVILRHAMLVRVIIPARATPIEATGLRSSAGCVRPSRRSAWLPSLLRGSRLRGWRRGPRPGGGGGRRGGQRKGEKVWGGSAPPRRGPSRYVEPSPERRAVVAPDM